MIKHKLPKSFGSFFSGSYTNVHLPIEVFYIKCIVIPCTKGKGSDCHKRGHHGKLVVCLSTDSGFIHLDCVFLAAFEIMRFLWEIYAEESEKIIIIITSIILSKNS